eukprot:286463_1
MSLREEAPKYLPSDLWLWNIVANDDHNKDKSQQNINELILHENELKEEEKEENASDNNNVNNDDNISEYNKWIEKKSFELKFRIEPSPFYSNLNTIIFAADHSGIYEYNVQNDRCKFVYRFNLNSYSPTQYSYIYNEISNEILFIGGRNSLNTNLFYDIIMIYNLNNKTMKQLSFGKKIGTNPKALLVGHNLHICGGSHNKYHILYNLNNLNDLNEYSDSNCINIKQIYQLPYPNGLMYHGFLYCRSQSTLLLFGGVYYNNITKSLSYSSDFWIFNLLNNQWNKITHKKLPKEISGFGYILYNDRIIIIFGGKTFSDKCINSIYYLDILSTNSQWIKSSQYCPIKGSYHAILEKDIIDNKNDCVHLFYCQGNKEHFLININDLLPDSNQVNQHQNKDKQIITKIHKNQCIIIDNIEDNIDNIHKQCIIDNNHDNNIQYNAIWIDKSKLTAKSRIECTPFYLQHRDIIIYSAEYNIYDENQGGIYEYDNNLDTHHLIEKFEMHKYYPSGHTCIYNQLTEEIIFIGGKNVKDNRRPYESMMIYDINNKTMTKILFKRAIGSDPKLLLVSNNLHIIGGSHNTYHLCYNLNSNELKPIYPFPYSNGLSGHGLIYCKLNNTIITFGGAYYDYISCSYQFCNDYWIFSINNNKYQCIYKKTLPQTINGFGYILYCNRIIVTFGGSIQRNKFIDNIYYTDILNINDSWKESTIKCPKKGGYHAILLQNQIVHLIHFGKEQFCMNIKDLLPKSMHKMLQNDLNHNVNVSNVQLQTKSNILRAAQSVSMIQQQQQQQFI